MSEVLIGVMSTGEEGGFPVEKVLGKDQRLGPLAPVASTLQNKVLLAGRETVGTKLFVVGVPEFRIVEKVEPMEIWMLYPFASVTGSQVKVGLEVGTWEGFEG